MVKQYAVFIMCFKKTIPENSESFFAGKCRSTEPRGGKCAVVGGWKF